MSTGTRDGSVNGGQSVFDRMVTALMSEELEPGYLDDCLSSGFDVNIISNVPLRYRLIALGFVRGSSLQELNEMLRSQGCAGLYSRNLWEAGLIYAFSNGLSHEEWKQLQEDCVTVSEEKELVDSFFQNSRIALRDLKEYVDANSDLSAHESMTRHLTKTMDQRIRDLALGNGDFRDFLLHNIESFSPVREKTRYYFCKYLCYYLESCMERFLRRREISQRLDGAPAGALGSGSGTADTIMDELAVFKGITKLKRKKLSDEEVRELLRDSGISFGAIFDAFNYYYFDYVSLDWMEVLLEYYGDIASMPEQDRADLTVALRSYEPKKYAGLSDEEVLRSKQDELEEREAELDRIYSLHGTNKGYQRNRAGENTIRKYVKGSLDIDRITLICFLLFFDSRSDLPPGLEITRSRLDAILDECGYAALRETDEFDDFIIRFIASSDPTDLLMQEVTNYALDEENFFLFRMYYASRSAESDIESLMI